MCALILFPSAANTSIDLLNCRSVRLAASGIAALNGGAAALAVAVSSRTPIDVSVLSSNPFFVCWSTDGSHRSAGIVASVTLVLFVAFMPSLTLFWAWQALSPATSSRARMTPRWLDCVCRCARHVALPLTSHSSRLGHQEESDVAHSNRSPITKSCEGYKAGPRVLRPDDSATVSNSLLVALLGDYRAAAWPTRFADLALLLILALLSALLARPTGVAQIATKAGVSCAALLLAAGYVAWTRPFHATDAWKGWVRVLLLLDSVACTVVNALVSLSDAGIGGPVLTAAIPAAATAAFAACAATFAVLVVGFAAFMYQGMCLFNDACRGGTADRPTRVSENKSPSCRPRFISQARPESPER